MTDIFIIVAFLDILYLTHLLTKYMRDEKNAQEFWATLIASIVVLPVAYYLFN